MTSPIYLFLMFLLIVSTSCVTFLQVDAFGARRQYHSYHHISQKKRSNTSTTRITNRRRANSSSSRNIRRKSYSSSAASSLTSNTISDSSGKVGSTSTRTTAVPLTSSSLQDETELLLERAAQIRELNARRREVLLTSATSS